MAKSATDQLSLTEQAYDAIHADILSGELAAGSKLRIDTLKERYSIGPTPLREALAKLSAIGFVNSERNRGFSIPDLTLADLRDITNQRKLVEISALRQSIAQHDEEFEAELVAAYFKLSRLDDGMRANDLAILADWEDRHRAFHQTLIKGSRSPWLIRFQSVLYDQADRYRRQYIPRTRLPDDVFDDHQQLLDATLARDADTACALLDTHIERVYGIAAKSGLFS